MRVLRLTPFFHHPDVKNWPAKYDSVGGMQIQIWRQAMWMAQQGVQQHVMTIGFPGLPRERHLHPELCVERTYLQLPEFRSELSGLKGLTLSWALATLFTIRKKARQKPFDLIHLHLDGQIPALLVAYLVPKLLPCPLILTIHCSRLSVYQPMSIWDRMTHKLARFLERKAVKLATTTIALTERTTDVIRPYARRVEIIPDVVDPKQFRHPGESAIQAFRQKYGLKTKNIGFIGRIAKEKGWTHFVAVADRLRHLDLHFLVVGDGPQRHRLEEAIAQHHLESQFTITGFIPNDQVATAIAACHVIVMPSEHEEFGGVSIEATSVGVPVVAYAVGGINEILGKISPELLAPAGDINQLVNCINRALTQPQRPPIINESDDNKNPIEIFAPDTVLPRLKNIYQELVEQSVTK
ncbi:glycosyltransferase [Xenorhabdus bovienii]|uniref:glycosyltransferase n=1 Tax=Xenorhabdus bovienii TaxID=40576 RepID=UPI003DA312E6